MTDVLVHLVRGIHWKEASIRIWETGETDFEKIREAPRRFEIRPSSAHMIEWYEATVDRYVATVERADPDDTVGTMLWNVLSGGQLFPILSSCRNSALETAVHRWDVERARGAPGPINDDLAADWLNDILRCWLGAAAGHGRQAQGAWTGESFLLSRSDAEGSWRVTLHGPGRVTISHDDGVADVRLSGPASNILLWMMNRTSSTTGLLAVDGDQRLLERWTNDVRYGTAYASR